MKIINLLPKPRQQELRYIAVFHSLWIIVLISMATFVLVFLGQVGTKFYLRRQAYAVANQIGVLKEQLKQNESQNSQVKAQVKAVNDLVSDYNNLAQSPKWSRIIKAFVPLPPLGVKINNFSMDPASKKINITGFAPTRELVILLYNNILKDSKNFYDIDYPLENVAKPANINFHFTFFMSDELVKP